MKSACMDFIQILWRQREGFTYSGPDAVYPATLIFSVVGEAQLTAFAAPDTLSAPLSPPHQNLLFLQIPENPSSNPSV